MGCQKIDPIFCLTIADSYLPMLVSVWKLCVVKQVSGVYLLATCLLMSFCLGNCVYHVGRQGLGQWFKNIGQNVEMTNFTQALYDARELAMERMQTEAVHLKAEGIVGVQIKEGRYFWDSRVIEFFAVGTAVVPIREDHHIPTPQLVLSVND